MLFQHATGNLYYLVWLLLDQLPTELCGENFKKNFNCFFTCVSSKSKLLPYYNSNLCFCSTLFLTYLIYNNNISSM